MLSFAISFTIGLLAQSKLGLETQATHVVIRKGELKPCSYSVSIKKVIQAFLNILCKIKVLWKSFSST